MIHFLESFESYREGQGRGYIDSAWSLGWRDKPTLVAGRNGGQALQRQTTRSTGEITFLPRSLSSDDLYFGSAIHTDVLPNSEDVLLYFKDIQLNAVGIYAVATLLSDGKIRLDCNGLTATTAAAVITAATWHYVEIHMDVDNVGTFELRVDEVVQATINGDTEDGINHVWRIGIIGKHSSSDVAPSILTYDDMYLGDSTSGGDYIGDMEVDMVHLSGDGSADEINRGGLAPYPINDTMDDWDLHTRILADDLEPAQAAPVYKQRTFDKPALATVGIGAGETILGVTHHIYGETSDFGAYEGFRLGRLAYHQPGSAALRYGQITRLAINVNATSSAITMGATSVVGTNHPLTFAITDSLVCEWLYEPDGFPLLP